MNVNKESKKTFFPNRNLAPKSFAVQFFAFLLAFFGGGVGYLGSYFSVEVIKVIGFVIVIIAMLIFLLAFLHHFIWMIRKVIQGQK